MARKPTISTLPRPGHVLERKIDPELLLSEEKKAELREKARIKVTARDLIDAEEAFLASEMARVDREAHPEAHVEMREIRIDLALYCDRAVIDGRHYFANELYTVPKPVYDVLKEMERNSYRHEREINSGNTSDNFYRRERNMNLNWKTGAATENGQPVRF